MLLVSFGYASGPINVDSCGADPLDTSDSSAAIQTCFNNACTSFSTPNPSGAQSNQSVLQFSAGTYALLKPLIVACANGRVQLAGAGANQTLLAMKTGSGVFNMQSYGPAIVVEPSNSITSLNSNTTTGAALVGTGQSLFWNYDPSATPTPIVVPFALHLDQVFHALGTPPLNGLSALDVRFFAESHIADADTTGATTFFVSDGRLDQSNCGNLTDMSWSCKGAAQVYVDTSLALHAAFNISGTAVNVKSANNAWTVDTVHEVEAVMDGANACLFLDGTRVATTAQAGTITQRVDEDMVIGYEPQYFPMSGPVGEIWKSGPTYMDSFEIRKAIPSRSACSNLSYTKDTTKFLGDSNSLLLLNFDKLFGVDGSTTTTSPALIEADYFNGTPASGNVGAWLSVRNEGLTSGNGVYLHDLGIYGAGVGLYAMTGQNNQFDNLHLISNNYTGKFESNVGFNNESSNIVVDGPAGSVAAEIWTNGAGITSARNHQIGTPACGWACLIFGPGASGTLIDSFISPQSTTVWGLVYNNTNSSLGSLNLIRPSWDVENGGSVGAIWFAGPAILNVQGGGLTSAATTAVFTLGPTAPSSSATLLNVDGVNLANISPTQGTPANLINFISSSITGPTKVLLRNVSYTLATNSGTTTTTVPPAGSVWSNKNVLINVVPEGFLILLTQTTNFTCDYAGGVQKCSATLGANNLHVAMARPLVNVPTSVQLCEDATGSRTPLLVAGIGVSAIKLAGGAVTFTSTAGKCDQLTFNYDGTNLNEISRSLNQ
jgi:hypothetical protein